MDKQIKITEKGIVFCEVYKLKKITKWLLVISSLNLLLDLISMILPK